MPLGSCQLTCFLPSGGSFRRQSKTNPEEDAGDVRYLKGGAAHALRVLRAEAGAAAPDTPVFGGLSAASLGRRFTAAAAIAERGAVAKYL